jgi:hypothetical protein
MEAMRTTGSSLFRNLMSLGMADLSLSREARVMAARRELGTGELKSYWGGEAQEVRRGRRMARARIRTGGW